MLIRKPIRRYNPQAYVRGGAPRNVAVATQRAGFAQPGPRGVPVRPAPLPRIIPPVAGAVKPPPVDPLWTRANNTVMGFMNPMLAKLASARVAAEANARKAAAAHGQALGGALQASAKPMDESFNRGIVASSQVNDALANRLNTVGGAAESDLTAKLAQIGASDTDQVAKLYSDASNAGFATGSADLQQLIAERAAGGAYQAKLPGIGLLEGNRDLAQALSEMRQNFGEQEQSLTDSAVDKSFDLYNDFRGEKREDQLNRQEALAAQQELYVKQRMAMQALQSTAQTKQEKMAFDAQMKALDRQNAITMAEIRADTSRYGVDTRAATAASKPTKGPSLTGPANQQFITVNGQVVKNPNYKPGSGGAGNTVAQQRLRRNKAVNDINKLIFNPTNQQSRAWVKNIAGPNELVPKINSQLIAAGIDPDGPVGISIRKGVFKRLGVPTGERGNPSDKKRATP